MLIDSNSMQKKIPTHILPTLYSWPWTMSLEEKIYIGKKLATVPTDDRILIIKNTTELEQLFMETGTSYDVLGKSNLITMYSSYSSIFSLLLFNRSAGTDYISFLESLNSYRKQDGEYWLRVIVDIKKVTDEDIHHLLQNFSLENSTIFFTYLALYLVQRNNSRTTTYHEIELYLLRLLPSVHLTEKQEQCLPLFIKMFLFKKSGVISFPTEKNVFEMFGCTKKYSLHFEKIETSLQGHHPFKVLYLHIKPFMEKGEGLD